MSTGSDVGTEIVFDCTSCSSALSAGIDEQGEEFDCPTCGNLQQVPFLDESEIEDDATATVDESSDEDYAPGMPVVKIPKKKIILPTSMTASDGSENVDEEEILYDVGGPGLRMLAVASATVGFFLTLASIGWVVIQLNTVGTKPEELLFANIAFACMFLVGIIGMLVAKLSFVLVRFVLRLEYDLAKPRH